MLCFLKPWQTIYLPEFTVWGCPLTSVCPSPSLLQDCPPEAGDFRAQQCSAHNDVKYHGQFYEWLPVSNDPDNPCSLKCQAKGTALVVELSPKVLDGTRCYTESLDMCISGLCQVSAGFLSFSCSRRFYCICVTSFCIAKLSESLNVTFSRVYNDKCENWGLISVKIISVVFCVKEKWTRIFISFLESHSNMEE